MDRTFQVTYKVAGRTRVAELVMAIPQSADTETVARYAAAELLEIHPWEITRIAESGGALECRNPECHEILDLVQYRRKRQLCDDCEYELIIYDQWLEDFLGQLQVWKDNQVT